MNILIIGSGIVGLSTAFELALAGYRVTVVTRNYEEGASWVAGGMLAPFSEGLDGDLLEFSTESLKLYPDFIRRLEEVSRIKVYFNGNGILRLMVNEEERKELESKVALYERKGWRVEEIGKERLLKEYGLSEEIEGAYLFMDEGNVDSEKLMDALLLACENLKIRIVIDEITEVSRRGERVEEIRGYKGSYGADMYIFTTGAWSRSILKLPVFPVKGQILKIKGPELERVLYSSISYIIPKESFILVGATSEDAGFDTRPTAGGMKELLDGALRILPSLSNAEFLGVKVGFRPGTPDEKPIIHAGENYLISTGHYRNGILWAPVSAKIALDLVERGLRSPFLEFFSPKRFRNEDHIVRE